MNRKYVGILILLLILVVTVSSCGNQTNAPSGGPPDPGPEETPAPVEVEKITFTTGELTVVVPKDWTVAGANETMDGYVQEDAKLDTIYLVKNMETVFELSVLENLWNYVVVHTYNKLEIFGISK